LLVAFLVLLSCSPPEPDRQAAKGYRELLAEANARIETLTAWEAVALLGDTSVAFVDIREQRELDESGWIPGAVHAPRGLLEFYIDTTSSVHKGVFGSGKRIVFYCAGGGRSALATSLALDMGLPDVAHVGGGLRAWVEAGGPVERGGSTAG
jgi:rhodanese-related sulfurtransferase